MESKDLYEKFIVTDPFQSDFTLTNQFVPDTKSIFFYLNGILQDPDSIEEIDSYSIRTKEPCELGDTVLISRIKTLNALIEIGSDDIIGNTSSSMFKRYDGVEHLHPNQKYTLCIRLLGKTHTYSFTSKFSPFYSTLKIIRTDLLNAISKVTDEDINFMIWQNSKEVEEIAVIDILGNDKKPVYYIKQWVRYKTELDLLTSLYQEIATSLGSVEKSLGDMSFSKSINLPYIDDLLSQVKKKLDPVDAIVTGVLVIGKAVVKAGKTTYPVNARRTF